MRIRQAELYLNEREELSFYEVLLHARQRREIVIGYHLANIEKAVINPPSKNEKRRCAAVDYRTRDHTIGAPVVVTGALSVDARDWQRWFVQHIMALLGIKKFLIHYGGKWLSNLEKYVGGKKFVLGDVDGDEFCFMDLIKDIEEKAALTDFRVLWVKEGDLGVISNDVELIYMWDHIKAVKGVYHLYLEKISGPSTLIDTRTNKNTTTPIKKVSDSVNALRKSPRLTNQFSRSQIIINQSTKSPKSPKSNVTQIGRIRRSLRLVEKFKSKFTSTETVILSDEEDESVDVVDKGKKHVVEGHGNDNAIVPLVRLDGSDWEWDFPPSEKPDKPFEGTSLPLATVVPLTSELEPLDVISQCHLLGFDSVLVEEGYHSGIDSASDDDCYNFNDREEDNGDKYRVNFGDTEEDRDDSPKLSLGLKQRGQALYKLVNLVGLNY
ncbi:hypothetical protein LguiB_027437 [Lonicera macranthoides]